MYPVFRLSHLLGYKVAMWISNDYRETDMTMWPRWVI